MKLIIWFVLFNLLVVHNSYAQSAPWVGVDFKGFACQGEQMNYGPYDYRNSEHRRKKLPIVEHYHFTSDVQKLVKGKSGSIVGDLAYTLRAFPNHYKALKALSYYQVLSNTGLSRYQKSPVNPPVECYFQRAMYFVPDDATVKMLYASYLKKIKKYKLADKFYQKSIEEASEKLKPKFRYIYGLFLLKQKRYKEAKEQAKLIYRNGFPNERLKQKLITVGVWKE